MRTENTKLQAIKLVVHVHDRAALTSRELVSAVTLALYDIPYIDYSDLTEIKIEILDG
jgi:hypothetical protein